MKTLAKADITGKKVLLRVDYNVPMDGGRVTDNTRIKETLPTINYLLQKGAKQIIILTHLGRPEGKVVPELKLDPIAKELKKLLKIDVVKLDESVNALIPAHAKLVMLENLRFMPEEEANDLKTAQKIAKFGDIYVNEAFSVSHRAHMSVHAITKCLPSFAGFNLEKEVSSIEQAMKSPKRPFIAVIGGKKVSTKIDVIDNLLKKADAIIVGGAMIFTFYKATGLEVGKSFVEADKLSVAKQMLQNGKNKIMLPTTVLVADKIDKSAKTEEVSIKEMPKEMIGVDIGEESALIFSEMLKKAKTIIWNGPIGIMEIEKFAKGTEEIAKSIADATKNGALTVVGGGETVEAINKLKLNGKFTHVSTAGGAFLELVAGKKLPGVEVLK